jgi:hypothetical protein
MWDFCAGRFSLKGYKVNKYYQNYKTYMMNS